MKRSRSKPVKSTRLAVQRLENRCTPATASYDAITQTLTVIGADLDVVEITTSGTEPMGYLEVFDGTNYIYDSSDNAEWVRNLVVRFDSVDTGELHLDDWVQLVGNVSIFGAKDSQQTDIDSIIGGSVRYTASDDAFDDLEIHKRTKIGGNLNVDMKSGHNRLRLWGGLVAGNLAARMGNDNNEVEIAGTADFTVGGSVSFRLGSGSNLVEGKGAYLFEVGQSLTYVGGSGVDTFDSGLNELRVGGNAAFSLGGAPAANSNSVTLRQADIDGNLTTIGGPQPDHLRALSELSVGGSVTAQLMDGVNTLWILNDPGLENRIDGSLNYLGGADRDQVLVNSTTIVKNARIALGDSSLNPQFFRVGVNDTGETSVLGSLKVTGGADNDQITLRRLYVGKQMTLLTRGGDDTVNLDDTYVSKRTLVDLGGGEDKVNVELTTSDAGGMLTDQCGFAGKFTLRGGSGVDWVFLSNDATWNTRISFGAKVTLLGGDGIDLLGDDGDNYFWTTGHFEDFDVGDTLP
jgi:hypothetical protein